MVASRSGKVKCEVCWLSLTFLSCCKVDAVALSIKYMSSRKRTEE